MNPYVKLAQKTISKYVSEGKIIDISEADKELNFKRAGCFVTLHLKDSNELRGCIGTILPTCKTIAQEIINNAISATQDPRFMPLSKKELDNINISVDVLEEPEPIESAGSLDPNKYGVIVRSKDGRTGLLLPDIDGIDDVNYQIAIARQKANILPQEPIYLFRFEVKRFFEDS